MLNEVCEAEKDKYYRSRLYVEYKTNKQTKLKDTENKLVVAGLERQHWQKWEAAGFR